MMTLYGSLRRYKVNPASADKVIQKIQNEFVPTISKLTEFMS